MKLLRVLLLVMAVAELAHADTVVFKNGDRLTGTFVHVQGGNLELKSDALGDVTIPLAKVQSFSAEKPAVIVGKDRTLTRGLVELTAAGDWQTTVNGTSQTVSAVNVNVILPADTYHELAEVRAKPWQKWKGSANFGYAFQHGNQQTATLSTTVGATRERSSDLLFAPHLRTNYSLTMLFSKAQQDGTSITSNTISTNLREDYLFTERNFVFGVGELDHVDAEGLYLRQTAGGGFGHDLIHSNRTLLSVLGGLNYVHERFDSGPSDQSIQALLGEKFGAQINSRLRLDQQLNFYPDLRHSNRYRWDGSANLGFKISNHVTANAGVIELFVDRPAPGSHQGNIAVTTGVGYAF